MDFPIVELLDERLSKSWLETYFHPQGLCCPNCQSNHEQAYYFRQTKRSDLEVYRCSECGKTYTLYTGTVFAGRHLRPSEAILLLRGVLQGVSTAQLSRELQLSRTTVHMIRQKLHKRGIDIQPKTKMEDRHTETDEMFQNAGEKRRTTHRPRRSTSSSRQ